MSKRTFVVVATLMLVVGAAVRVNNALIFLPIRGYDGFAHFTYIWFMSKTWTVPLPTTGWSFFHPPLYYWFMAALWNALDGVDAILRLKIGGVIMGILSLTHAAVAYVIVRRYFPEQRLIHLMAAGLMLFIPVHIYSAPFLGNEGMGAALSSLSLLVLLYTSAAPSVGRSVILGVCLGLSMLAKFSGLAAVGGAFVSLGLQAAVRGQFKAGVRNLTVVATVMLAISGWYYFRNYRVYGDPFKMSRDEFMVRHVEHIQTKGNRGLLEYLTFDPVIFRRPQFPRGLPLTGEVPVAAVRSPIREGVWTGMYANTWFDGFGGWVLPPVYGNEFSRRAGQILLTLGLVPTLTIMLGALTTMTQLWRRGWDDTLVAMLATFLAMLGVFVHGTRIAPLHAAVKATYLIPITVVFGFWFALGLSRLAAFRPRWLRYVAVECTVLAVVSVWVFTQGLLIDPFFGEQGPVAQPIWGNLKAVVYYAGDERARAKQLFEDAAGHGYHLGFENLATLALEDGRPLEALHLLRRASSIQPRQSFGIPPDRRYFDQITQAEYRNSMAVIYHQLQWRTEAERAAETAAFMDPSMPEANYNAGVLKLLRAEGAEAGHDGQKPSGSAALLIRQAQTLFFRSLLADPGFLPGAALLGVSQALLGDCDQAVENLRRALHPPPGLRQEFPVETGRGIAHSASIGRRKHIDQLPDTLDARRHLARCEGMASDH